MINYETKNCHVHKKVKIHGGKHNYGLLPPRTLKTLNPFDNVRVYLPGPYEDSYYVITMVDHASRWLEVVIHPDKIL